MLAVTALVRLRAAARHLAAAPRARALRQELAAAGDWAAASTTERLDSDSTTHRRSFASFASTSTSSSFASTSTPSASDRQPVEDSYDAIVVGGGHNGLVAALLLAREGGRGFRVALFDDGGGGDGAGATLGGAARTEQPFQGEAKDLRHSTGAYLLGPFPPELLDFCGLGDLPIVRRSPHYFLPTERGGAFFYAGDEAKTRESFLRNFSRGDWLATREMERELSEIKEDFAPAMLCPSPRDASHAADAFLREGNRKAFVDLAQNSVISYLDRFGFESGLLRAMYCATDGLSGATASPFDDGTGYNFLLHNMVRLRQTDGAWALVKGGMGTVTGRLADNARRAGASLFSGRRVASIDPRGGGGGDVGGVTLSCGKAVKARVGVVAACDPWKLCDLAPESVAPSPFRERLDGLYVPATTFKLNLALGSLPRFRCLPGTEGGDAGGPEHRTTAHLLAEGGGGGSDPVELLHEAAVAALRGDAGVDASTGKHPPIEFYFHSAADPSVRDGRHHSAALFVQLAPHAPGVSFLRGEGGDGGAESSASPLHATGSLPASFEASRRAWTSEAKEAYSRSLLEAAEEKWCPGLTSLVADAVALAPPDIERRFGISGGHIHHVQNTASFGERVPLRVGGGNLFFASAGAHPGGSVVGAPGHNAAAALLLTATKNGDKVLSWPTIKNGSASVASWEAFARGL